MIATPDQLVPPKSPKDILIRRATPEDRTALIAMYESFEPKRACLGLPPATAPERWLDGLAEFPNFLALAGDRIAGHAVLCSEGPAGEVAVFVHQHYRSHGLGRRLLSTLVDTARELGLKRVWGTTDLDNIPMLRLARSLGFVSGTDPREFHLDLEAPPAIRHEIVNAT